MHAVRIQSAVRWVKAILRFRNATERPVVLTGVLLAAPKADIKVAALLPAPLPLGPGETLTVDVTERVIDLLKPLPAIAPARRRIRLRVFLDPPPVEPPPDKECSVTVECGRLIEFAC